MSPTRTSPVSFLKLSSDVASFYGFRPMREVERASAGAWKNRERPRARATHTFDAAAAMCAASASVSQGEPVLAYYATPSPSPLPLGSIVQEVGEFGLQAVGTSESVGEIILLKTLSTIFAEWGTPPTRVRVNALGDRESQQRFARELSIHVRKHANRLLAEHRAAIMENPMLLYRIEAPEHQELRAEAPHSLTYLSEKSRAYFRSMLEHLEVLDIPWEIDDSLVGDPRAPHVAFALDFAEGDTTIIAAMGGRFDDYLRERAQRKDSTGVGASIFFRKKGASAKNFATSVVKQKPKIYFAQLGIKAKLQGLKVVDHLRKARVPVMQTFEAAHLSSQLTTARALDVQYLFIMGQREAIDSTVLVRSMDNGVQVTLSIHEIPRFLRTLR
ncbi:hypothetical protein HYS79_03120 [Patescibacteria group bacterium]|nr:hypothetical protein [Patescibacteria group bacterium]